MNLDQPLSGEEESNEEVFPYFNGGLIMMRAATRFIVLVLITTFLSTTALVPAARSAAIDTTTYLTLSENPTKTELEALFTREDVRKQLVIMGVDPDDAANRIASLTPDELTMLQERIDNLPAGGNLLAVLGIVLVVFIVLELVGITDVFNEV